ncbi:MAG: Wzz/FepE/Etk N-terminal domain-containing protein [Candidatus Micropelagos thuwalensis]
MNDPQFVTHDNEIDLLELIKILWDDKIKIISITAVAAFFSIIYAFIQPNIYRADALLAPASDNNNDGMSKLAGQFGGIASLAGVSLSDNRVNKSELGLEVLGSRKFVREFVERHKILPQLMAVDYWDPETRKLVLDDDIYDDKSKTWLDKTQVPSNEEVYKKYNNILILEKDTISQFIRVGFKHESPVIAAEWTGLIIKDLNDAIRRQDINEAESSITYLRQQAASTPIADLRNLFYELIQSQTETMMLANVRKEYVFKTIDPATVPEFKSEPNRALICFLGTVLGGVFSLFYVLGRHYIRPSNS